MNHSVQRNAAPPELVPSRISTDESKDNASDAVAKNSEDSADFF